MFNTDQGNLAGKTGWIFFATCVIAGAMIWLEMPDTKDLTFAEIDERFEMRVDTRGLKTWRDIVEAGKETEMADFEEVERTTI